MRKEAGFEVTDRITVNFTTTDLDVKEAFNVSEELKSVVLAENIIEGNADGFSKELDVNGKACTVIINKVNK